VPPTESMHKGYTLTVVNLDQKNTTYNKSPLTVKLLPVRINVNMG